MSITVSNCALICNSPLNTSSAKNLWSFSKSSRFNKLENPSNCVQAFYDLPSVQDKRKAAIGYGQKYDLTKQTIKTPAPDQYQLQGDVDNNKQKNKGFQFGVSRDKMWQQGILGGVNKVTPGPGKYDIGDTLSRTKYSMRPKTHSDLMILNNYVPGPSNIHIQGPGTYQDMPSINKVGKYHLSKFSNSGATLFNPPRSKRFTEFKYALKVPGPGNYQMDNIGIQKDGKYFVSNLQSSKCRSFPHELRSSGSMRDLVKTPGPGTYRLPSDFGYYESKTKEQFVSKSIERESPVPKQE